MKEFLTLAQRVAIKRGLIKMGLDVWQLTGGASASAGTHSQGGAFDLLVQTTDGWVKFFRDLGATASWRRTTAQGFSKVHLHGVLNGCPHNDPARYQVTAEKAGYDGLGYLGRGGKDYHPAPNPYRTWTQGVTVMKAELAVAPTPTPTPTPTGGFLMALTDAQQKALYDRVMGGIPAGSAYLRKNTDGTPTRVLDSADGNNLQQKIADLKAQLATLQAAVDALPKAPGA